MTSDIYHITILPYYRTGLVPEELELRVSGCSVRSAKYLLWKNGEISGLAGVTWLGLHFRALPCKRSINERQPNFLAFNDSVTNHQT